jgi:hypothetical protein
MYFNTVVTDIIRTVFFRLDVRQLIETELGLPRVRLQNGSAPHALTPARAGLH